MFETGSQRRTALFGASYSNGFNRGQTERPYTTTCHTPLLCTTPYGASSRLTCPSCNNLPSPAHNSFKQRTFSTCCTNVKLVAGGIWGQCFPFPTVHFAVVDFNLCLYRGYKSFFHLFFLRFRWFGVLKSKQGSNGRIGRNWSFCKWQPRQSHSMWRIGKLHLRKLSCAVWLVQVYLCKFINATSWSNPIVKFVCANHLCEFTCASIVA